MQWILNLKTIVKYLETIPEYLIRNFYSISHRIDVVLQKTSFLPVNQNNINIKLKKIFPYKIKSNKK